MRKVQSLFACLMALSLLALTLPVSAESAKKESFARVVAVHGAVDFSVNGGASQKMRPNMDLPPGAMIHTGPDSTADISANGSVVRVQPETSVTLETMSVVGSRFDGDTETMLNLKTGTVVGSVKKLSANSHY